LDNGDQVKFLWSEAGEKKTHPTSGISEQQEENSMIFPRLEFEGIWGQYFGLEGYFQ
jgi:hypothetical protein